MSVASSSKGIKRSHKTLSIADKVDILKKLDRGTSVKNICVEFGIGSSTVYDIKKQKAKIIEFYAASETKKGMTIRKSMKEAANPDVDKILMQWFRQRRSEGLNISGAMIMEQAKLFHSELKLESNCEYSAGWLQKFKKRHGISVHSVSGEKLSADQESADDFIDEFEAMMKDFSPENVYNADETALFWRCLPKRTLACENEQSYSGMKEYKDRITVLVCSNAAGTHKLKLLVIGKSKKPRAFTGVKVFPVHYRGNKCGWMTNEIMLEWYNENFVKESRRHATNTGNPNAKIILILDNCSAHPDAEIMNRDNISVIYLPPNCTSLIQPQDQGIIRSLKCRYRTEYMRQFLTDLNSGKTVADVMKGYNIKDAVWALSRAWESVPQSVLYNCWLKLWPSLIFYDTNEESTEISNFEGYRISAEKAKINELVEYANGINNSQVNKINKESIDEWLNVDSDVPIVQHFTDEELISSVQKENEESEESDSESELPPTEKISIDNCITLGQQFLQGIEKYDFISDTQLMNVHMLISQLQTEKQKRMKQTKLTDIFKRMQ